MGVAARQTRTTVKTFQHDVHLRTAGGLEVTDITDEVREAVRASGIGDTDDRATMLVA